MIKTHFFPPSTAAKRMIPSLTNIMIVFIWLELSQQKYKKPFNWNRTKALLRKDAYNIEVGRICRTRISVHPRWDASLHMNNRSSHAVDVCFCCVASAEDNFRAHVNLWRTVKKRLINRGIKQAKTNCDILWSGKLLSKRMHPTSTCSLKTKHQLGNTLFVLYIPTTTGIF